MNPRQVTFLLIIFLKLEASATKKSNSKFSLELRLSQLRAEQSSNHPGKTHQQLVPALMLKSSWF